MDKEQLQKKQETFRRYLNENLERVQRDNATASLVVRLAPSETVELGMAKAFCKKGFGSLEADSTEGDYVFTFAGFERPWG